MKQTAESTSTACLSVTPLANSRWAARLCARPLAGSATAAANLLCSDAITVGIHQLADPDFDAASFVMEAALEHTEQYCRQEQVRIEAFQSVEVLRFVHEENCSLSFLFVMEPAIAN